MNLTRDIIQTMNPRFSILVTDYDKHVNRERMLLGIDSLKKQSFKDFEVIICHDGPKEKTYEEEGVDFEWLSPTIINSETRHNDWGHSLRDKMMKMAKGDWFLHFNIDNILYENCLQEVSNKIDEVKSTLADYQVMGRFEKDDPFSVVFYIKHWKLYPDGSVLRGTPPRLMQIDLLQMVIHRDIWKDIGYWYNKKERSDGVIYEQIGRNYPWTVVSKVLAENF